MTVVYDSAAMARDSDLPAMDKLTENINFPDPLVMLNGEKICSAQQWNARRAELALMFQHYMYGYFPPAPNKINARELFADKHYLSGAATLREIRLGFDEAPSIKLNVLIATPNSCPNGKVPAFVGTNFGGNASIIADPRVALPQGYIPNWIAGVKDNKPTDNYRGRRTRQWPIEQIIARGYGLACFYHGDIDPDKPDYSDGIQPNYYLGGQSGPGQYDWGSLAAWAWGLMRVVDYLQNDDAIDSGRIASVGHSRNGKVALLATGFDERIKMAVSHQSGCGGSAPSRTHTGETLADINKMFPHWFNSEFKKFVGRESFLPFDQHCLISMCAPRAVLLTNARKDVWANPHGQFEMLRQAEAVYELLGEKSALASKEMPGFFDLVSSRLGYWYRPGKHAMGPRDWEVFMDYADSNL